MWIARRRKPEVQIREQHKKAGGTDKRTTLKEGSEEKEDR
jgi:hypothetical protein